METTGNALPADQPTVHLAGPEGTRLRFSGPPGSLTGKLPLINTGTDKQKIRSVAIAAEKLQGAARMPLREVPFHARLYGGEQASVPATIQLDPQTPPGAYDFDVTVGERTLPATAYVSEVVDLRLDPVSITLLAGASTSYTRTLVVENAGNVPLPTGAQCEAPIFDSFDLYAALITGLHKGDRTSAESMTRAFLNEWADLQAGVLITKRKAMILAPGQKLAVDVEFNLPSTLKPLRHYRASLQLYNATLSLDIYTTAKTGNKAEQTDEQTTPR